MEVTQTFPFSFPSTAFSSCVFCGLRVRNQEHLYPEKPGLELVVSPLWVWFIVPCCYLYAFACNMALECTVLWKRENWMVMVSVTFKEFYFLNSIVRLKANVSWSALLQSRLPPITQILNVPTAHKDGGTRWFCSGLMLSPCSKQMPSSA